MDGAANQKGLGIRIMIDIGKIFEAWLLDDEVEYEAHQARLVAVQEHGGKSVREYCDLRLIAR